MSEINDKKFKISVVGVIDESYKSAFLNRLKDCCEINFFENQSNCDGNVDLVVLVHQNYSDINSKSEIINIHPALLPSFKVENALYESFISGVKVGGISVHKVSPDNFWGGIITQYPVLIGVDTHFDEFENEILSVEKSVVPFVIEAILNDRVFDFADLFGNSCRCNKSGCGGNCSECAH